MRGLGNLEAQVMRRLWERHQPATVRDILGDLQGERSLAYTTVMTVMDNLHRKGWLRRDVEGRAYRYEPAVSAEEYGAGLMREALEAGSDRTATFMRFVDEMSPDDARALEETYSRLRGASAPDASMAPRGRATRGRP